MNKVVDRYDKKEIFAYKMYLDNSKLYTVSPEIIQVGKILWKWWNNLGYSKYKVTKIVKIFKTCAIFRETEIDDNIIL